MIIINNKKSYYYKHTKQHYDNNNYTRRSVEIFIDTVKTLNLRHIYIYITIIYYNILLILLLIY